MSLSICVPLKTALVQNSGIIVTPKLALLAGAS